MSVTETTPTKNKGSQILSPEYITEAQYFMSMKYWQPAQKGGVRKTFPFICHLTQHSVQDIYFS
jgi:hypothetical protein